MTATVSLVVAVPDPRPDSIIAAFEAQANEVAGEILLVERRGRRDRDALVPTLWREGLLASKAPFVAFTTAAMTPRPGWLRSLLGAIVDGDRDVVGGPIEPSAALLPLDAAIYLARYANYRRPAPGASPAGENAVYRRSRLVEVAASWERGFWESEVHAALARTPSGLKIGLEPNAVLEYSGGASWRATLRRRFLHGRRYGATRGKSRLRALAAPLVPLRLGLRTWHAARTAGPLPGMGVGALSHWAAIVTAWATGEGIGLATRSG